MKIITKLGVITLLVPTILASNHFVLVDKSYDNETRNENLDNNKSFFPLHFLKDIKVEENLQEAYAYSDDFSINILEDEFLSDQIEIHNDNFKISDELQNRLDKVISAYPKNISFYGISLDGKISFGYNPDTCYSCASSIKAPYALYCYKQIETESVNYNDIVIYNKNDYLSGTGVIKNSKKTQYTIEELLYNTIYYSDNIAYGMLYKYFGVDGYNKMLEELGCSYLQLTPYSKWGFASPREMALVWQEIYNYKDTETGSKFFETLLNAQYNFIKSALSYDVAHKSGWSTRGYNDHGIVFADTPYIISVMMPYPNDKDQDQKYFQDIVILCDEIMNEYNNYLKSQNNNFSKTYSKI